MAEPADNKKIQGNKLKFAHKYRHIVEKIWEEREEESRVRGGMKHTLRLLESSVRKFLKDEGMLRATSISYSLVVSFIPLLVVALLVGAKFINIDEYFFIAKEFVRKNGIPLDLDPYFEIIKELLSNANAITTVGFLILIFSATSILRNLENAMNTIWLVRKGRPWIQKIGGFILVLIFGPVLMTFGVSMGQSMVNMASAPGIVQVKKIGTKEYALGEKGVVLKLTPETGWENQRLANHVDFEAQKQTVFFDSSENRVLNQSEREPLLPRMDKSSASDLRGAVINDMVQIGDQLIAVTSMGDVIHYREGSSLYDIRRFQRENLKLLFGVTFKRIEMFNQWEGVIIGDSGLIMRTDNGGLTWRPSYATEYKMNWNDIASVSQDIKIMVGDSFQTMVSNDGGLNWKPFEAVENLAGKDKANLNSISVHENRVWIAGDFGSLLKSEDYGKSWKRVIAGVSKADFHDILMLDKTRGLIVGEAGMIKYTEDGGDTWRTLPQKATEDLYSIEYVPSSGRIFISGEDYLILEADAQNFTDFQVTLKSPFWRKVVTATGNFFLPFLVIGLIFFIMYKVLPYTQVDNKAALVGAAVTSMLWVIFLLVFKFYLTSFSTGTFAIYGTLAAIPLTLLLVYTSVSIMLYGAEIGFFIQNPMMMSLTRKDQGIEKENRAIWYGMRMLYLLYDNFEKGKGETKESTLISVCGNDHGEFNRIMGRFLERDFVRKVSETGYAPLGAASNIHLFELVEEIDPSDYNIPGYHESDPFMYGVRHYFDALANSRREILEGISFGDLLKKLS